jgi:hypothetical protein
VLGRGRVMPDPTHDPKRPTGSEDHGAIAGADLLEIAVALPSVRPLRSYLHVSDPAGRYAVAHPPEHGSAVHTEALVPGDPGVLQRSARAADVRGAGTVADVPSSAHYRATSPFGWPVQPGDTRMRV